MGRHPGGDDAAFPGPRQVPQPPVPPQGLPGEGGRSKPAGAGRAGPGHFRLRRRCRVYRPGAPLCLRPRRLRAALPLPLPQPHLHAARTSPPGRLAGGTPRRQARDRSPAGRRARVICLDRLPPTIPHPRPAAQGEKCRRGRTASLGRQPHDVPLPPSATCPALRGGRRQCALPRACPGRTDARLRLGHPMDSLRAAQLLLHGEGHTGAKRLRQEAADTGHLRPPAPPDGRTALAIPAAGGHQGRERPRLARHPPPEPADERTGPAQQLPDVHRAERHFLLGTVANHAHRAMERAICRLAARLARRHRPDGRAAVPRHLCL